MLPPAILLIAFPVPPPREAHGIVVVPTRASSRGPAAPGPFRTLSGLRFTGLVRIGVRGPAAPALGLHGAALGLNCTALGLNCTALGLSGTDSYR